MLAKHALSQLSYSPIWGRPRLEMVGLGRVELPTSPLSGVRSNQLSYRPELERCLNPGARRLVQKLIRRRKGFEELVERAKAATPPLTIVK